MILVGTIVFAFSYETEIKANLLNFVDIVKTTAGDVTDSLCDEGDQCYKNDTSPIPPIINNIEPNRRDEPPTVNDPDCKKGEPCNYFSDSPLKIPDKDNSHASDNPDAPPTHVFPPRVIPASPTDEDPWRIIHNWSREKLPGKQ